MSKTFGKPFRILSIDGGGLRGIVPVKMIEWIENNVTNKPIFESFDLFAGTSTGALIACALAVKHDTNKSAPQFTSASIGEIYEKNASNIFPIPKSKIQKKITGIKNLWGPKFSSAGLEKVLETSFGDKRLSECLKPVFITSYDNRTHNPLYFSNRFCSPLSPSFKRHADGNAKLKDICRATSAAPTYFSAHKFNYIDNSGKSDTPHCIDGGVFANNPSLSVLVEVLTNARDPIYTNSADPDVEISERDIHILSLGTGVTNKSIGIEQGKNWGVIDWGVPVIQIMMQGNSQAVDYQLNNLIRDGRYLRMDINIESQYANMDDARDTTRQYLINQVNDQVAGNYYWTHCLNSFKNLARL